MRIQAYYDQGHTVAQCRQRFGFSSETCGLEEWLGRPLSMALHHVNGEDADNRLENLQMLCPNCHSQTENFAGRNRRPLGRATLSVVDGDVPAGEGQGVEPPSRDGADRQDVA